MSSWLIEFISAVSERKVERLAFIWSIHVHTNKTWWTSCKSWDFLKALSWNRNIKNNRRACRRTHKASNTTYLLRLLFSFVFRQDSYSHDLFDQVPRELQQRQNVVALCNGLLAILIFGRFHFQLKTKKLISSAESSDRLLFHNTINDRRNRRGRRKK